jgi:hypothetical protein
VLSLLSWVGSVLSLLGTAALYGLVTLLVTAFGFHTELAPIRDAGILPASGQDLFSALMIWSVLAYPVIVAADLLVLRVWWAVHQRQIGGHMEVQDLVRAECRHQEPRHSAIHGFHSRQPRDELGSAA